MEKARELQRNVYFIDYIRAFDCVAHSKLWKILKEMGEMGVANHLTSLLKNLYMVEEATVRIGPGRMDWFKIGKGVQQGCIW